MRITRLRFLSLLSSGFALAAAGPVRLLASPGPRKAEYSAKGFEKLKHTSFAVSGPGGVVVMVLEDVKTRPQDRLTDQFSLFFSAPAGAKLPEGTYPVNHPNLTSISLFVCPSGTNHDGKALFRADFNLLRDQ